MSNVWIVERQDDFYDEEEILYVCNAESVGVDWAKHWMRQNDQEFREYPLRETGSHEYRWKAYSVDPGCFLSEEIVVYSMELQEESPRM